MADAEELLALRWRPTYTDLNAPTPDGVPHKTLVFWSAMKAAEAEKSSQKQAMGKIGEELEEVAEEIGG